jgi:hypothetical protein
MTVFAMSPNLNAADVVETTALGTYGHNRSGFVRISTPNGLSAVSYCGDTPWLCRYIEPRVSAQLHVSLARPYPFAGATVLAVQDAEGESLVDPGWQEQKYASDKFSLMWQALTCTGAMLCFAAMRPRQTT